MWEQNPSDVGRERTGCEQPVEGLRKKGERRSGVVSGGLCRVRGRIQWRHPCWWAWSRGEDSADEAESDGVTARETGLIWREQTLQRTEGRTPWATGPARHSSQRRAETVQVTSQFGDKEDEVVLFWLQESLGLHRGSDTHIHGCSSPSYKMASCVCITCAHPAVRFTAPLDDLQYLMQCKCCVSSCWNAANSSFASWNLLEFFLGPQLFESAEGQLTL